MNIDYPGELQIKQSICEICDKGIKKPDTCFSFIKNMTKNFGFEKIFHGVYCVIFICFLVMAVIYSILSYLMGSMPNADNIVYLSAFLTSPLLFSILFFLSYVKEKSSDIFLIKMTCKYTFFHLMAYRMFIFSLLSVITNSFYIIFLAVKLNISVISVLSISMSALFVYSACLVIFLIRFSSIKAPILLSVLWCLIHLLFFVFQTGYFITILKAVPVIVWGIIAVVSTIIYLKKLPQIALKGRNIYAYN